MTLRKVVPLLAVVVVGTALGLWLREAAKDTRPGWSAQVLRRIRVPDAETLVDVNDGADDFVGWMAVTERGDVLLGAPERRVTPPGTGERFLRATNGGLAITDRGSLFSIGPNRPAQDLHLEVPAGSLLADGEAGTWIAPPDGSLVLLERGTTLRRYWEGGASTSALTSGRGQVLVGRATGAVEVGDSKDSSVRRQVFTLEGPITAVAIGPDACLAAADSHGHVRVERPLPGGPSEWNAGGAVVALAFQEEGPAAGPIALRGDGTLIAPPRDGREPSALCRLGARVDAVHPRGGRGCAHLLVATAKGVHEIEATYTVKPTR